MSVFKAQQRRSSLALDLGTTTGYAIAAADGQILSGTVSFRPSRYDGGGIRYLRFRVGLKASRLTVVALTSSILKTSALTPARTRLMFMAVCSQR